MPKPDDAAKRLAKPGDGIELYGGPNRFGGRPVVARIERQPGGYAAGSPERVHPDLAGALADLSADQAESDGWTFVSGGE